MRDLACLGPDLCIQGNTDETHQQREYATRVEDCLALGELMCVDALDRNESGGPHYREDRVDDEGEARRDDENWCFVSAWERGDNGPAWDLKGNTLIRHAEPLTFEAVPLMTRNYK